MIRCAATVVHHTIEGRRMGYCALEMDHEGVHDDTLPTPTIIPGPPNDYEFTVGRPDLSWDAAFTDYSVSLPHSCDEWVITYGATKGEAVADFRRFIEAAYKALLVLEAK